MHCSLCTTPIETPTIYVCWCISKARGPVPLPHALFTVHNTYGNTDNLYSLVYSRGEGNCSPPKHYSLCKTPMETPMVCVRRCIREVRGTIPLLMSVTAIVEYQVPERIIDRQCIVHTFYLMHLWLYIIHTFYWQNHGQIAKNLEGFFKIVVWNKNFNMTLPRKSPTD